MREAIVTIFATTGVLLLFLGTVALTVVRSQRRAMKQQILMSEMELNYQKELRTIEIETQEQTLAHFSRELHDNISQLIVTLSFQMEKEKIKNPSLTAVLTPSTETIKLLADQVRLLSHALSSDLIERRGLILSIDQEVARIRQLNLFRLTWLKPEEEPVLVADQCIVVFRIFQEVISNILKHAIASNVTIRMESSPFRLLIQDDGKGFDLEESLSRPRGYGLLNVRKRADMAGLSCAIESKSGIGSRFLFSLPEATKI